MRLSPSFTSVRFGLEVQATAPIEWTIPSHINIGDIFEVGDPTQKEERPMKPIRRANGVPINNGETLFMDEGFLKRNTTFTAVG